MAKHYDVAVIGAGAAGMMCAAVAAQRGKRVVLLDHATRLAEKIRKGSSGTWGPIPMPANPQVSEADAKTLAKWILSQK